MFKIGEATTWSPECHHWHPPEDAEATSGALELLREALRQAEARELAALAELDEANAMLRKFSWSQFRLDEANAKLREFTWQPIETAPRDRVIMLYRPGEDGARGVAPGSWDSNEYAKHPKPFWRCWLGRPNIEWDRFYQPTLWMERPAPPPRENDNAN